MINFSFRAQLYKEYEQRCSAKALFALGLLSWTDM